MIIQQNHQLSKYLYTIKVKSELQQCINIINFSYYSLHDYQLQTRIKPCTMQFN